MRFKVNVAIPLFALIALGACDKFGDQDYVNYDGAEHGDCEVVDEPHPYLSCADDAEPHPVCETTCGYEVPPSGEGHMLCGMPCEVDADCYVPKDGDSTPACIEGGCHLYCNDEVTCPSDLECVNRGDVWDETAYLWGECLAPYTEGS